MNYDPRRGILRSIPAPRPHGDGPPSELEALGKIQSRDHWLPILAHLSEQRREGRPILIAKDIAHAVLGDGRLIYVVSSLLGNNTTSMWVHGLVDKFDSKMYASVYNPPTTKTRCIGFGITPFGEEVLRKCEVGS